MTQPSGVTTDEILPKILPRAALAPLERRTKATMVSASAPVRFPTILVREFVSTSVETVFPRSDRGEAVVRARFSRDIRMDVLFAPFHWGGRATINWLTNPALDPISKIPEFKACAVRAERVEPADARSTAALQTERAEVA